MPIINAYSKTVKAALLIIGLTTSLLCVAQTSWSKATQVPGVRDITVYRSESCGCCGDWLEHLRQHDFNVTDNKVQDMGAIKKRFGVPVQLASCHTAIIGGYVIEGHVPANDIKRLLQDKPEVAGLSVPGMPVGTPGMEMGERKDPFSVIQFKNSGQADIYRRYESY